MVDIVTRAGKGSPLTNNEVDANFTNLAEVSGVTGEPMGHEDRTTSTISFNASTRTFTIAPVSSSFTVWCKGKKVVVSSAQTVTIPNTTGMYSIYYDANGVLAAKAGYFTFSVEAPTAYVYWNAATGACPYFGDERHGVVLDWQTHEYLHRTRGAALASGFGASGYTLGGNGSSNAHAQLTLEGGTFFDEDMKIIVTATNTPTAGTWEQDLLSPARIPVLYLSGTGWVIDAPTDYPLKQGTARPQYNALSGGVWSTADVANNKYATSWILATNNLTYPVIAIIGQAESDLQSAAEAVDFTSLQLPGFPSVEFRPLYRLVFQCADSFSNAVKASLVSITDIRSIAAAGVAASLITDHGNLSGLSDDDHPQYLSVDTVRGTLTAAVKASFLPSQAGNAGKFLTTDATSTSWASLTSGNITTALGFTPYNATNPNGYITGITSSNVTTALGFTPYNATNPSGYITTAGARGAISVTGAGSYDSATGVINIVGGVTSFNTRTGAITLSSADVTTALGFTPYNSTNPNGYLTGITSTQVTTALGYTPYNSSNPSGYITGITSSMVTTALGFTPYNNSNPSGYITSSALSSYLPLSGGTMTGVITTPNGTYGIIIGDDSRLADRNIGNTLFLEGNQNSDRGYLNFSQTSGNSLGAVNGGDLTWRGNSVLHAGNYTSYSPTLTGGSASGTWGISITGNSASVGGITPNQFFNNMGNNHNTYTDFNSVPGFGAYYVQQGTNSPTGTASHQWYGFTLGLGNDYALSDYGTQLYWPRRAQNSSTYIYIRDREGGSWTSWTKVQAGYADSAGSASTASALSNFVNQSGSRYSTDVNSLLQTGFYNVESIPSNSPVSYGQIIVAKGIDTGLQIAGGYNNDQLFFRGWWSSGGGFSSWRTVLHNGNYSSYALPISGGNLSGDLQLLGNYLRFDQSGTRSWNMRAANGDLNLTSGDTSGAFYVTLTGGVRSPIFYDSDNTGYYVNAAGGSQLNQVSIGSGSKLHLVSLADGNHYLRYVSTGFSGVTIDGPQLGGHQGGELITNFGGDNWSLRWDYGGNTFSRGSSRAPIFYDSNDTGYYCDPASFTYVKGGIANNGEHGSSYIFNRLLAANNGAQTGEVRVQMWCSEPGNTWDYGGFGYNVDNGSNSNSPVYYFGRPNPNFGQAYMRFSTGGEWYFYNTNTTPTRFLTMQLHSSGYVTAFQSSRAPIFYDSDNTAYYIDPASSGKALLVNGNIELTARSESWGEGIRINVPTAGTWGGVRFNRSGASGPGNWAIGYTGVNSTDDFTFWSGNTNTIQLNLDHSANLVSIGSMRAPIFYDYNDTGYYIDPNTTGTSIRVAGYGYFGLGIDGDGVVINHDQIWTPAGNFHIQYSGGGNIDMCNGGGYAWSRTSFRAPIFYDSDNTGTYINPNGGSVISSGGSYPMEFRSSQRYITRFWNQGASSYGWWLANDANSIVFHADSIGDRAYLDTSGHFTATGSSRAPIFYDSNDTGYYVNPNSTSNVISVYAENGLVRIEKVHSEGGEIRLLNTAQTQGGYIQGWDSGLRTVDNNWVRTTWSIDDAGNSIATASHRAPIFYDSDNTGYYVDPASTTQLNYLYTSNNIQGSNGVTAGSASISSGYGGFGGTPSNGYLITTNINYSNFNMPLVIVEGFAYGNGVPINLQIVWYSYNNGFVSYSYTNLGAWDPGTVRIGTDGNGKICIHFSNNIYYGRMNVRAVYDQGAAYLLNWSVQQDVSYSGLSRVTVVGAQQTVGGINTVQNCYMPIMYDVSNTAYYVDPAGGSRMNGINADSLYSYGNVTAYSDERLKTDWEVLPADYVEKLAKVKSGTYTRIDSGERQVGVGAQSLQSILKEAVSDKEQYLGVNYGNAALASAVELAKEVVDLRNRVAQLESLITKLIGD